MGWDGGVIVKVALWLRISIHVYVSQEWCLGMSYFDDRHDIVGRVLELAHVDIEVTQLVLLRLLQHQVAPLSYCIDALQVACGVEVGIGRARQRDLREVRGGCGVLGHVCVFGVAVEEEGRVAVVGRVFLGGSAVVAVASPREEAHGIYMWWAAIAAVTLSGRRAAAGNAGRPGRILGGEAQRADVASLWGLLSDIAIALGV